MAEPPRGMRVLLHADEGVVLVTSEPATGAVERLLVTTDLLLRRIGAGSLGELQQQLLSQQPEPAASP